MFCEETAEFCSVLSNACMSEGSCIWVRNDRSGLMPDVSDLAAPFGTCRSMERPKRLDGGQ